MNQPLRYAQHSINDDDIRAVTEVLRSDWLTQGPATERFEAALCEYTGASYAVAVSNGTAALELAYRAVKPEMGFGTLHTSPLSFVATANAALLAGYDVTFGDVDQNTGNLAQATLECDVLVPVHYAGRACPLPEAAPLLPPVVVEDGAHALGASCVLGCCKVGSCNHSTACCLSFHAIKSVACGEGGAVLTRDQGLADEIRLLRSHGRDSRGDMVALGSNHRMTEMQAALGLSQLSRLDAGIQHRAELAALYSELLGHVEEVKCPVPMDGGAWHLYTLRVPASQRRRLMGSLAESGIETRVNYPAIHLSPYYRRRFGYGLGDFPVAEEWAAEEMSLPLHVAVSVNDARRVCEELIASL